MAVLAAVGDEPTWVDARPFRAQLRYLMRAGSLTATEVAVVTGLSTRAVTALLDGRDGRPARRVSPETARRLLRVGADDVLGLRWRLSPTTGPRAALLQLAARGWSRAEISDATAVGLAELDGVLTEPRCNGLVAVRLVGLARALPDTPIDQHAVVVPRAA